MAIIGGGPAGMMAAHFLSPHHEVHLYEQKRNIGRKFLVAGEGGFNLTNQLEGEDLVQQYSPPDFMRPFIEAFGSADLRSWLRSIGIETFIGSSGRVFPVNGLRPIHVLQAIRNSLIKAEVIIHTEHRFTGFDHHAIPIIDRFGERSTIQADRYFFALGGASWPSTGSDGKWCEAFRAIGIRVRPFRASNCGVEVDMPVSLLVHAGRPLKNISISCAAKSLRGEFSITTYGLEGNAIYPIVPFIRSALENGEVFAIKIDLKPDIPLDVLIERTTLAAATKSARAPMLDRTSTAFLKAFTSREIFHDPGSLAKAIKNLQVPIRALRPIEEAISSVGGISLEEVGNSLQLLRHPHLFVMGEMLDWDAPTGGSLLQGCFSTGCYAASCSTGLPQDPIGRIDD
ncbi:MAG: NAD(P)-dependent oxidoreductase [Bacteroidota bacterium]|nr:NAD(P)-dependent oxidoreductase [Bacteroidota bacterium]